MMTLLVLPTKLNCNLMKTQTINQEEKYGV